MSHVPTDEASFTTERMVTAALNRCEWETTQLVMKPP